MEEEYIEFSAEELEAIQAGITEEFFEIKQYFIQKPPIQKMFTRKLNRLQELIDIQQDLFPDEVVLASDEVELIPYTTTNLNELFDSYYANKNRLKQKMFASLSMTEVQEIVTKMCDNERDFGALFEFVGEDTTILVSKEPDAMAVHEAIQELAQKGKILVEDVKNNTNEIPLVLLNEMKRLFLLFKKY